MRMRRGTRRRGTRRTRKKDKKRNKKNKTNKTKNKNKTKETRKQQKATAKALEDTATNETEHVACEQAQETRDKANTHPKLKTRNIEIKG